MSGAPEASFTIEHETSDTKGYYRVELNGAKAEMTYSKAGDAMIIIDSTEVPDVMRGQKVGAALVSQAVGDARSAGKKIMPLCPFAKAQFARHSEWHDVLF
ncbi:Acetyltransferase [Halomonas citrativorans]|uniref:Acetyltransferase n=1 Tax=Halomonas citrativorans TaxID=2742612 RepID=A0A1R4HPT2_9GAMM|nr:GNAT family N-acetyltransferase [Halomonas citrativorans]MBE0402268.1 N-acetyltransferase [Halomonas citrativorans]SJN09547.1 Acetyltransferase [Halomonas citrativorans]